jgi:hypothetical protein
MKTTIEEINGVKHTVVWHSDMRIGYWINCGLFYVKTLSHVEIKDEEPNSVSQKHVATALPALPRNPTADDAELLHFYAAHGLTATYEHEDGRDYDQREINCAIDKQGNRVEIAIEGGE